MNANTDTTTPMRHAVPRIAFTVAAGVTLLVFLWLAGSMLSKQGGQGLAADQELQGVELQQRILYLDEVLTMSARMAASTAEAEWEQRYKRFEPQLIEALEEAAELVPGLRQGRAHPMGSHTSQLLLALNHDAFDLVRAGQQQAAQELLSSELYKRARSTYDDGMRELSALLKLEGGSALAGEASATLWKLGLLVTLLAVAGSCWAFLWRAFSSRAAGLDSQAQLRLVALEAAANAIFVTDPDGRIVWVNPAYCQVTGYSPAESIGQIPRLFDSNRLSPHARKNMWATLNKGSSYRGEVIDQRKNGSEFPSSLIVAPVSPLGGPIAHLVVVMEDTSDRRAFEKGLVESMDTADTKSRQKSEFLAHVSDRIRTPLDGILSLTQIVKESGLSEEQLEHVRALEACGQSLLTLISDVYDISQLNTGKLDFQNDPTDLRILVDDACGDISNGAPDWAERLDLDFPDDLPGYALIDGSRFEQVLVNLLDYALELTGDAELKVQISWHRHDGLDKEVLRVEINTELTELDTTPLDSDFDPFGQNDSDSEGEYSEFEISLMITKQLVEHMSGSIGAEAHSAGTCFHFELPLETCQAPDAKSSNDTFSGLRVLVAEDDRTTRLIAYRMLLKIGCTAEMVPGGEQAVVRANAGEFDLILMDCLMPEVNGYEATRRIRQAEAADPQRPHIPILALSALATDADLERSLNAGMDAHLTKPLDLEGLRDGMLPWLDKGDRKASSSERKAG